MSETVQALCFLAGANSIFYGERLLTTPNPGARATSTFRTARARARGRDRAPVMSS
jgi:biotin synthase-like enzyme